MEQLLLVNPRKRRGKKRRTAAQRAATARMLAANRARKGRKSYRRNPAPALSSNPRRRRRSPVSMKHIMRRRRRNPIGAMGGVANLLMTAAKGAVGATAVDLAVKYVPIPDAWKAGRMGYVVKGAAALALGTFGRRFFGSMAKDMAVGSLTVTLHTLVKDMAAGAGFPLAGMGYTGPGYVVNQPMALPRAGMAEYVDSNFDSVGSGMGEYIY